MTSNAKKIQPGTTTQPKPRATSSGAKKSAATSAPRPKPSTTVAATTPKPAVRRPLSVVPDPAPFQWTPICDSVERDLNMSADELISPRGLP